MTYLPFFINVSLHLSILIYLRVLWICIPKFLNDEFDNIEISFAHLQYPKSFIQHAKIKALKIYKCECSPEVKKQ